jgi:hypothetical protein
MEYEEGNQPANQHAVKENQHPMDPMDPMHLYFRAEDQLADMARQLRHISALMLSLQECAITNPEEVLELTTSTLDTLKSGIVSNLVQYVNSKTTKTTPPPSRDPGSGGHSCQDIALKAFEEAVSDSKLAEGEDVVEKEFKGGEDEDVSCTDDEAEETPEWYCVGRDPQDFMDIHARVRIGCTSFVKYTFQDINVGDLVKVGILDSEDGGERIWVRVTSIDPSADVIEAHLTHFVFLDVRPTLRFCVRHVMDVLPDDESDDCSEEQDEPK